MEIISAAYIYSGSVDKMVMEYEAKFRVKDHESIERALKSLGAVYEEEVLKKTTI